MLFSAHASACAILAFADGGSRNSSLHPPLEALGISTLAQGSQDSRSVLLAEHREPRRLPPQATEFAKVCTAVKPAVGGLPSSVTVRLCAAPCHLPQGGRLSAPASCKISLCRRGGAVRAGQTVRKIQNQFITNRKNRQGKAAFFVIFTI